MYKHEKLFDSHLSDCKKALAHIERFINKVSSDAESSISGDTSRTAGSTSSALIHHEPPSSEELEGNFNNLKAVLDSLLESLPQSSESSEDLEDLEKEISECDFDNPSVYKLFKETILSEKVNSNIKEKLLNTFTCSSDNIFYCILRKVARHTEDIEIIKKFVCLPELNINLANKDGFTPLHIEASNSCGEIVDQLLRAGADVDKANKDGFTPLHIAVVSGCGEIVDKLFRAGADVDKANQHGLTSLHIAAVKGYDEIVGKLLDKKADVNQVDKNGFTPLHIAAAKGNSEIAKLLLKNKANMMLPNEAGKYFIEFVPEEKLAEFINLQDMHNNSLLHHAIMREDWRFFNWLLQQPDININIQDDEGRTLLSIASMHNMLEYVELLLDSGADPTIKDIFGTSIIMNLAAHNNFDLVQKLIEKYPSELECEIEEESILEILAAKVRESEISWDAFVEIVKLCESSFLQKHQEFLHYILDPVGYSSDIDLIIH